MLKKLMITLILGIILGVCVTLVLTIPSGRISNNNESVIDSLKSLRASYESVTDSLFILRGINDSLRSVELPIITKYKVSESIPYITQNTPIDSIQTMVVGSDTAAVLWERDLQVIDSIIYLNSWATKEIAIQDSIIGNLKKTIVITDTIISRQDLQIQDLKKDSRKKTRKSWLIGAGTGAIVTSLIWILF